MRQLFGDFREDLPKGNQFLLISFAPSSLPLQQRWRNNGLSADFVADYLGTFFPISEKDPSTVQRQLELKSAVSYIANELLENAMKFHAEDTEQPIQFGIHLLEDRVILFSLNCITLTQVEKLIAIIKKLLSAPPDELYIEHLENLALEENSNNSGMGLLTIMHDYLAQLGWKIENFSLADDISMVTTMVQLAI
jgi:hypothetical protein